MFPDSIFVLGYDTAKRLVMLKYYGDSELTMLLEFARWVGHETSWCVAVVVVVVGSCF